MKIQILALFAFSTLAFADPVIVKTCHTRVGMPGATKSELSIQITRNQQSYSAEITQVVGNQKVSYHDKVTMFAGVVRQGLSERSEEQDLNPLEKLISHAMMINADRQLRKSGSLGFNLRSVRSGKVYQIGDMTEELAPIGTTAIVEAYDKNGKILGCFLGGFLVSRCKIN